MLQVNSFAVVCERKIAILGIVHQIQVLQTQHTVNEKAWIRLTNLKVMYYVKNKSCLLKSMKERRNKEKLNECIYVCMYVAYIYIYAHVCGYGCMCVSVCVCSWDSAVGICSDQATDWTPKEL